MDNSITIVYFDNKSYLHNMYIGCAITALRAVSLPVATLYIDEKNTDASIQSIQSKYIIFFLSLGKFATFEKACKFIPNDAVVIMCHYAATHFGKEIMSNFPIIDYAVVGEFDITLPCLIQLLIDGKDSSDCLGHMIRDKIGVSYTGDRPQIKSLDTIGFIDRELIPRSSDIYHIFASRGCEGNCTFCDRNALYINSDSRQRFRSIKNVMLEIDSLVEKYGCRFITFSDSTFCGSENIIKRLDELYFELNQRKYWIQFFMNLRAEQVDNDVLDRLHKLQQVGLSRVFIGIESFNESDLKLYNKNTSVAINKKVLKLIGDLNCEYKDYVLDFEYGFILFNPYTTMDELDNNLNILFDSDICLTPNLISSRLVCNCIQPLTKKIHKDGLLVHSLNEIDLSQKTSFDLKYKFQDKTVEKIYGVILSCYRFLSITFQGNIIYLINRYYHYFGNDANLCNLKTKYSEWSRSLSEFCKLLVCKIVEMERNGISSDAYALELCKTFKDEFTLIERSLQTCKMRVFIQLKKIGEAIYG